jgi:flagellar L-ring protein precursor FlgH
MRTVLPFSVSRVTGPAAVITLVLLLNAAAPIGADSLYVAGKSKSMFADHKARAVGDVVTVLITESTVATQDANLNVQRSVAASAQGGTGGPFNILEYVPKSTLSGSTTEKGSGATSRSSQLTSTITCRVVALTPAGQLVLDGDRKVRVNTDTQTIKFSGIVRPEDISPENTVPSGAIADAHIEVLGKGPINRHVTPSILARIFQFLF